MRSVSMGRILKGCLILCLFAGTRVALGQENKDSLVAETDRWQDRITVSGYVKYLQSALLVESGFGGAPPGVIDQLLGGTVFDHLLHHRLNLGVEIHPSLQLQVGWRNRLFFGDQPRLYALAGQDYGNAVDVGANDYLDLSFLPLDRKAWVAHSVLDRLYLEWRGPRDEVRLGRQRINWGLCTIWNPNDLFNAFSFTDFDYEERPGADALRWTHYLGESGRTELVLQPGRSLDASTYAMQYHGSLRGAGYQVLLAWYRGELALGGGWEADLWEGAWKLESTAFVPVRDQDTRQPAAAVSTDWTRSWESGLLLGGGYLLNTAARIDGNLFADLDERLSARNLYPFRHNLFLQGSYPVSPLFSTSLAAVYSPGKDQNLFLAPVLTLSVATDWDLDLTGQVLVEEKAQKWASPVQAFFLRLRWSY